jgi:hypothetical protein
VASWNRKKLLVRMIAICAGWLILFYGFRLLTLGRLTLPTTAEFTAIAERSRPIVQAIYDYKADHGFYPKSLSELAPTYLQAARDNYSGDVFDSFDEDTLYIDTGLPHTHVYYVFRPDSEGWYVGGECAGQSKGPLPLQKLSSTRPAIGGDASIRGQRQ